MGPKKDKKNAIIIEGVDTTDMTFQKLQQYALMLYERLLKERQERNYFQLERDKLRTFWELSRRQLDESRAQLMNQDHELELAEDRRQHDLREVDQKVKFLQYEQKLQVNEMMLKEKNSLMLAEKDYAQQELELLVDKKELKQQIKSQEELHQQENKALRLHHGKEITDLRKDFENKLESMEFIYERKLSNTRQQLETKHKMEITEIEERKNMQIKQLTENHSKAFDEIRNYYNNITLNNFSLITSLKENIEEMKKREAAKDKHLREVQKENKVLSEALAKDHAETEALKHQVANYEKETLGVNSMKREMNKTKVFLDKLKWEYDVLNLRFENNKNEKNKSDAEKILQAVEIQQQIGTRICYMEEKLKAMRNQVEKRDNFINDIRDQVSTARDSGQKSKLLFQLLDIIQKFDDQHSRSISYRQSLVM